MSAQQSLTFLLETIAIGFITIATIDLSREIIALYKQVFVAPKQPPLTNSKPQVLPQLPDPWTLPIEETAAPSDRCLQEQPKSVLLLAQAKAMGEVRSLNVDEAQSLGQCEVMLKELLLGVDLDRLQLRPARKLAKVLGIAQKTNGRDQKLTFLRGQIKLKLQETRSLKAEVIAVLKAELTAC